MKRILFILFLQLIFCTSEVEAQTFESSLAPHEYEIIAKPGTTIPLTYILTNTGDPTVFALKVYLVTSSPTDASYTLTPYNDSTRSTLPSINSALNNFGLDSPFLLASQEAVEFDLLLSVPSTTSEQDYYLAVVAESEPNEGFEDTNRLLIKAGTGSMIYLSVTQDGTIKRDAQLTLLSVPSLFTIGDNNLFFVDSSVPVPLNMRAAAPGLYNSLASGQIIINPEWGESVNVVIPSQRILGGAERLLFSDAHAHSNSTYELNIRGFNFLTIQGYIQFDYKPSSDPKTLYLVALPLQMISIILGIIALTTVGFILHRYVKKLRA